MPPGEATFTADYEVVTKFGNVTTPTTVVQAGAAHRAVTIGQIRFVVDGADIATCDLGTGVCSSTIDAARVSNVQLTPDFYVASAAAKLRRYTELRAGPTRASTETIAGQPATCVDVPTTSGDPPTARSTPAPWPGFDAADQVDPAHPVLTGRRRDAVRPA